MSLSGKESHDTGCSLKARRLAVAIAALLLAALSPQCRTHRRPHERHVPLVENWPLSPPPGQPSARCLASPRQEGVCTSRTQQLGDVWMYDKSASTWAEWAPSGKLVREDGAHHPRRSTRLYGITDRTGHQVKKYTAEGKLLMTIGKTACPATDLTPSWPDRHSFHAERDLVISDGYWNSRVVRR